MSEQEERDIRLLFAAGRIKALEREPYYEKVLMSLIPVPTNKISTLGVDESWRIYYNPNYISQITLEELAGVILHEVNHVVRGHCQRYKKLTKKNPKNWNIATDIVINRDLIRSGVKLPPGVLTEDTLRQMGVKQVAAKDFYPEAIYQKINQGEQDSEQDSAQNSKPEPGDESGEESQPEGEPASPQSQNEQEQDKQGRGEEPGGPTDCGSIVDGIARDYESDSDQEGFSESDKSIVMQEVFEDVEKYEQRNPGKVPAGILREIENRLNPKEDWLNIILKKISNKISYKSGLMDYSYARPSRRNTSSNIIMPSMRGSEDVNVYVIIDTSGSMKRRDLTRAVSETQEIMNLNRGNVFVISCDAKASEIMKSDDIEGVNLIGGGGTNMREAIVTAEADEENPPDVIVVFTDGGTPWPKEPNVNADYIAAIIENGSYHKGVPDFFTKIVIRDS